MTPAGTQTFATVSDPFSTPAVYVVEERDSGNPLLQPEVAYEWSYGVVYSPKWFKGLTVSADWWHIDLRSSVFLGLGSQGIIESNPPPEPPAVQNGPLVFRAPSGVPGVVGPVTLVINPNDLLSGAVFEGLDYEASYILESSIFGHGDFGTLTATVNGTWLSRAKFQAAPNSLQFGIGGLYIVGSGFPWDRANFTLYYDGPRETWMRGLDVGAVVHWTGQYNDDNAGLTGADDLANPTIGPFPHRARKIAAWTTVDLILNYTFNLPRVGSSVPVPGYVKDGGTTVKMTDGKEKNVMPVSTADYGVSGWRWWLNNTTISLGIQNVLDADPPFAAGNIENGYDESLATIKGRFWYIELKKRF